MRCNAIQQCFEGIDAWFRAEKTGHFLLVNTDSYAAFREISQRIESDTSKTCLYVSENCYSSGLPDIETALTRAAGTSPCALIGVSQALQLYSTEALERRIDELLEHSISGYGLILLEHCSSVLRRQLLRDPRLERRVILLDAGYSALPKIFLVKDPAEAPGGAPLEGIPALLQQLEKLSGRPEDAALTYYVHCRFDAAVFHNAGYSFRSSGGFFGALLRRYPALNGVLSEDQGTEEQWQWLSERMGRFGQLSAVLVDAFGASSNLSAKLADLLEDRTSMQWWLLWLGMKISGERSNRYISRVLQNSETADDLWRHIWLDFADTARSDPDFFRMKGERRRLLRTAPEDRKLEREYCSRTGKYQKDRIWYLSDETETERYALMECLSLYEWTEQELQDVLPAVSEDLSIYYGKFAFDRFNTKLSGNDPAFLSMLTQYFHDYRRQKLTNRIDPAFLEQVNALAVESPRPWMKLPSRSAIIRQLDRRDTKLFFIDALGVEYLPYVLKKCADYDLLTTVFIGCCTLPSITDINKKELLQYFDAGSWCKIDDLDDLKHKSQKYDYQVCRLPIHLFEELSVIDEQLRQIRALLDQGQVSRALIAADHGASRLAVLYGKERDAVNPLDEKAEHSGRCCRADSDPEIPEAVYENGFAVLASYERFKGGRKASVEVHGGASLEEVLVPVIMLTKRPEDLYMEFAEDEILLQPRNAPTLILYSSMPLQQPRLRIGGEFYDGEALEDMQHFRFLLPVRWKKGEYDADVFDGEQNLSCTLHFSARKKTQEIDLFS